jgi:VanZ family protein
LWYRSLKYSGWQNRNKQLLAAFITAVLFGILMEICQGLFTIDRSADLQDVVANTSGSAIAVLVFWLINKLKK